MVFNTTNLFYSIWSGNQEWDTDFPIGRDGRPVITIVPPLNHYCY